VTLGLDPEVGDLIRLRLGDTFDDLIEVMFDLGTPPVFLSSDDRPRLVKIREDAKKFLDEWQAREPDAVDAVVARLPEILRVPSLSESMLEAVTWDAYFELNANVFDRTAAESRVFAAIPELANKFDDDGLIDIAGLDARPHGLMIGDYSLHYHQLLRRNFRSHIHYELVGTVLGIARRYDLKARLAVDDRRLRYADEYEEYYERDHWYGRPLSEPELDALSVVGETYHADPQGGSSLLHPYAGLSVRWTSDGALKVVQVEEFVPPISDGNGDWILTRYLHAIRDTSMQAFIHCDGAVKAYRRATYPRTQEEFRRRGKGDHYKKVFRLDGAFPAQAWSDLMSSWFRGNVLALEYLNSLDAD
jgi:hypothetical protein